MEEIVYGSAGLSGLILALVETLKRIGWLPVKYAGFVALSLGLLTGIVYAATGRTSYAEGALMGLIAGASASGLYSNIKTGMELDEQGGSLLDRS